MSGKRELDVLGRTGVENVKQDALALFDSHRLTESQAFAVDGEALVADLPAVGLFLLGLLRQAFALLGIQLLTHFFGAEEWLPFVRREKNLLIVPAGV